MHVRTNVDKVLDQAEESRRHLLLSGCPQLNWHPPPDPARGRGREAVLGRVCVCTQDALLRFFPLRRGARLTPRPSMRLAEHWEGACPAILRFRRRDEQCAGCARNATCAALHQRTEPCGTLVLEGPIESWMTWLHPARPRMASRRFSGRARIRGTACTGYRWWRCTEPGIWPRTGAGCLFTSYLKNRALINRSLLARMAPDQARRVEFATVHAVALKYLSLTDHPGHTSRAMSPTHASRSAWAQVLGLRRRSASSEAAIGVLEG